MKLVKIAAVVIILLFVGVFIALKYPSKIIPVSFRDKTIKVWIADTDALRTQGLSGKRSMPKDYGMLFLFPTAQYQTFWMKDMNFSLDFLWIQDHKVVDMTPNVPAPVNKNSPLLTYSPKEKVNAVLELNAGSINRYGLQIGDSLNY